jgi:hypothetical protein
MRLLALMCLFFCGCAQNIVALAPKKNPGDHFRALYLQVDATKEGKYACHAQWKEWRIHPGMDGETSDQISVPKASVGPDQVGIIRVIQETPDGDAYQFLQGKNLVQIPSHRGLILQIEVHPLPDGMLRCRGFFTKSAEGSADALCMPYDVTIPAGRSVPIWQVRSHLGAKEKAR